MLEVQEAKVLFFGHRQLRGETSLFLYSEHHKRSPESGLPWQWISKQQNRGVGKLGFNFLLLKRRDFIVLSIQLFLWTSPSHMETYLGWGPGAVPSTLEEGYTRVRAEINQSKTTSVRILSLALVISCLHFKGCVIFNLIISHLKRVSFSLLKNHWD